MTRHDEMLAETALREVRGLGTAEAVRRLFEMGLISRREASRMLISRPSAGLVSSRNAQSALVR